MICRGSRVLRAFYFSICLKNLNPFVKFAFVYTGCFNKTWWKFRGRRKDSKSYSTGGLKIPQPRALVQRIAENNRNSNTLMGQNKFYWKVALQKVIEIKTKCRQVGFTSTLLGIPYFLELRMYVAAFRIRNKSGII